MKSKITAFLIILLGLSFEFSSCKKEDSEQKGSTVLLYGSITALNCSSTTNNGTLTSGEATNSVSSILTYTGGNGGTHSGQVVGSTGVSGLTASLAAGVFATGSGNLTYTITGTPSAAGIASFALNIGGQTCILNRTVNAGSSTASCGATNVHNPSLTYGSMTDQDGNVYKTIVIGAQEWMAENLKASHYRNGDVIPVDTTNWTNLNNGATCWYNNDSATYNCPYGKLYNWYAVADNRHVCPTDWHEPSNAEWTTLTDFLTGATVAGGKMKSTGTQYWTILNAGATNSSGFSGLPGGIRDVAGFYYVGNFGYWWSSTGSGTSNGFYRRLDYDTFNAFGDSSTDKAYGFSVRCIKD
ncbi:MAG: FISUMP domain-containing protein [Bacteroidota bacterium]|jgi:uncharacterized protein (TIGR02145 family)